MANTYETNDLSDRYLVVKNIKVIDDSGNRAATLATLRARKNANYQKIVEFQETYELGVAGDLVISGQKTTLSATVSKDGILQHNSEFALDNEFRWESVDGEFSATGKTGIDILASEIPVEGRQFKLYWNHDMEGGVAVFTFPFSVFVADRIQYTWSNISDYTAFMEVAESLPWYNSIPASSGNQYLWRRFSRNGGNTWEYLRETGEKGDDAMTWFLGAAITTYPVNDRGYNEDRIILSANTTMVNGYSSTVSGYSLTGADEFVDKNLIEVEQSQDQASREYLWTLTIEPYAYDSSDNPNEIPASFTFNVTMADGTSRSVSFSRSNTPTYAPRRFPSVTAIPTRLVDENGVPYLDGDYTLVKIADAESVKNYPYIFKVAADGTKGWRELQTSDTDWAYKASTMIVEATGEENCDIPNQTVFSSWVRNFFAQNAVINNLGATNIKILVNGSIYSGCYDKQGNPIQGNSTEGFYLGSNGILKANNAQFYDISINNVDKNGKSILKTLRSEAQERLIDLSIDAEHYRVGDVASQTGQYAFWMPGTISFDGSTYERCAVNTDTSNKDMTWDTGTKPTELATERDGDRFFYIFSDKDALTETTSRKGLVSGGFRGKVTIKWQIQTQAMRSKHDNNCWVRVSEDNMNTWKDVFSTGWRTALVVDSYDDEDDWWYKIGSRNYELTLDVTPNTIIQFDFYRTYTYMKEFPIADKTIYSSDKYTEVAIEEIAMKKEVLDKCIGFADSASSVLNIPLDSHRRHADRPMSIINSTFGISSDSADFINYVSGSSIISAIYSSLVEEYAGAVSSATYRDLSNHSFSYLVVTENHVMFDSLSIYDDTYVNVTDNKFLLSFRTVPTATGIEIDTLYCHSFIGMIQPFICKTPPNGWLLLAGGIYPKSRYPRLGAILDDLLEGTARVLNDADMEIFPDDGVYVSPSYFRVPDMIGSSDDSGRSIRAGSNTAIGSIKKDTFITKSYRNGSEWYRIYSDGWVEQGGYADIQSNGQTVSLLIRMKDTDYHVSANGLSTARYVSCHTRTTTTFNAYTGDDESFNASTICWEVKGYAYQTYSPDSGETDQTADLMALPCIYAGE